MEIDDYTLISYLVPYIFSYITTIKSERLSDFYIFRGNASTSFIPSRSVITITVLVQQTNVSLDTVT